jgi:hypothetical protein
MSDLTVASSPTRTENWSLPASTKIVTITVSTTPPACTPTNPPRLAPATSSTAPPAPVTAAVSTAQPVPVPVANSTAPPAPVPVANSTAPPAPVPVADSTAQAARAQPGGTAQGAAVLRVRGSDGVDVVGEDSVDDGGAASATAATVGAVTGTHNLQSQRKKSPHGKQPATFLGVDLDGVGTDGVARHGRGAAVGRAAPRDGAHNVQWQIKGDEHGKVRPAR